MRNAARSAPHAAPTIRPIAPASRRAARLRCNACNRTCRACRRRARPRCARSSRQPRPRPRPLPLRSLPRNPPRKLPKNPAKETVKETVKETATEPARPAAQTAAPAPKVTATPAAKKPSSAQLAAIKSACRSDYMKSCSDVPPGGAPALNCLEKNKSKLSPSCEQAVNAAGGGGAKPPAASGGTSTATAPATAPADAPAPAPALVLRPMLPREELFVLRSACGEDVRALCSGVAIGGGRVVRCLASQAAALSPACRGVLGQFAAQ